MLVLGAVHAVDVANRDFQRSVFIDRSLIVATAEVLEIQRCIIQLDLKCGERQARISTWISAVRKSEDSSI